jgi:hypothetical protein
MILQTRDLAARLEQAQSASLQTLDPALASALQQQVEDVQQRLRSEYEERASAEARVAEAEARRAEAEERVAAAERLVEEARALARSSGEAKEEAARRRAEQAQERLREVSTRLPTWRVSRYTNRIEVMTQMLISASCSEPLMEELGRDSSGSKLLGFADERCSERCSERYLRGKLSKPCRCGIIVKTLIVYREQSWPKVREEQGCKPLIDTTLMPVGMIGTIDGLCYSLHNRRVGPRQRRCLPRNRARQ